MLKQYPLECYIGPTLDLETIFNEGEHWGEPAIGFDGSLYFLRILNEEAYNEVILNNSTDTPFDFEVAILTNHQVEVFTVKNQTKAYHFVQPLPKGRLIMVDARVSYYGNGVFDQNASVFKRVGNELQPLREFLIGDGISHLYTTEIGTIWTGYFDEGIFGSHGWGDPWLKGSPTPIGEAGVIQWNSKGDQLFPNEQVYIAECYSMNVVSNHEVWFYYYDSFKIVHLKDGEYKGYDPFLEFASDLVVNETHLMLRVDADFYLYEIEKDGLKKIARLHLVNENEKKMGVANTSFDVRGDRMVFQSRQYLYDVRLHEIVEMVKEKMGE
ncbi:hypothetical protein [Alkalicoccobacillus gibsonii]|uniref:hypothetical protein n=1 Tax=Alkalicoccobacillus gibsonii TaxID=79881 RepID=UPI00193366BA|nr:hypothetical protein [Alkalicoccobacillus gibsonii]MBM0066321.1 hypothetical protein [Alkalicoccobacillus gibsonii]